MARLAPSPGFPHLDKDFATFVNQSAGGRGVESRQLTGRVRVPYQRPQFSPGPDPHGGRTDAVPGAGFDAADLIRVAGARAGLVAAIATAVVALTFIVLLLLPNLYTSSAVVMLDTRRNAVADLSSVLTALPTDAASLQNQIQLLTSRDLAAKVIARTHLYENPDFYSDNGGGLLGSFRAAFSSSAPAGSREEAAAALDAVIDKFLKRLDVETQGLSTTISVNFTAGDPETAARVANAVAQAYIEDQLTTKFEANRKTTEWLTTRVRQLGEQVQAAEAAAQQYRAEHNLDQIADGTPLVDQQMAGINGQIVLARADLAQKSANYGRVTALVGSGHAADVSQIVASPLIVQLRSQEAELLKQESEYASKYGPKHPKMIAAEQQKRDLETKIDQEVTRIAGAMANDVAASRAQLGSLEGSLKASEKQAGVQNFARVKLKQLEGNAASTRAIYDSFVVRLRQTQDQDEIQNSDARIISRAAVPSAPSSPKRTLILAASIPAGLLLGLLVALLLERFGASLPRYRRARRPKPIRPFGGAPVVAFARNALDARAADYVIDYPTSAFAHAMDELVQRLMARNTKVLAVTSAQHGEGKTAIAVALARAAAHRGARVVLVEGDLKRPMASRAFGIAAVEAGVYEATRGAQPLSRCLYKDPRSNALVLSSPRPLRDPHILLGSRGFAQLIEHLRHTADLVIVDCAPALSSNDTPQSARLADAVLMVVRDSDRPAVAGAVDAMLLAGVPPIGVVLAV
jgi:succinoglycan biosynthesis transport protein ExoP